MCRGQHAIYLGYGCFLKLAKGTSMHTYAHTNTQWRYSCLLPQTQKHTFAPSPQTQIHFKRSIFFFHFSFFIFGSDTGSTTPAFKETNCSLRVPFSRFLPLQKGPTVPKKKKLASLHPALQLCETTFWLSKVFVSQCSLYTQRSGAMCLALPAAWAGPLEESDGISTWVNAHKKHLLVTSGCWDVG